jgi:nucleoside diphosphate kinase
VRTEAGPPSSECGSPLAAFRATDEYLRNSAILASLAPGLGETVQRVAFLVLKPDAVSAGLTWPIIARLKAAGHCIVDAFVAANAGLAQFEELYKYNIALGLLGRRPSSNWWLNGQLFEMGRVVCVLTVLPDGPDPWGELATLKGPSNPLAATMGQLRADFGAANRALNLIHASDNSVCSVREYLLFHSLERLRVALDPSARVQRNATADLAGFCLQHRLCDSDPVRLLIRVERTLLEIALTQNYAADSRDLLCQRCEELEDLSGAAGGVQARMQHFFSSSLVHRVRPPVLDHALQSAQHLEDPASWSIGLAKRTERLVNQIGYTLSAWDNLVLKTTLFYGADARAIVLRVGRPNGANAAEPPKRTMSKPPQGTSEQAPAPVALPGSGGFVRSEPHSDDFIDVE